MYTVAERFYLLRSQCLLLIFYCALDKHISHGPAIFIVGKIILL